MPASIWDQATVKTHPARATSAADVARAGV